MTEVSVQACLARAKVFASLDDAGRDRLAELAQPRSLAHEEVLIEEGTAGDAFYLLVRGLLRVESAAHDGAPERIATAEPGTVLGEIAVLTREPRTATVTADTPCEVLEFEMLPVLAVLKDYPDALADLNRLGLERSEAHIERLLGD